MDNIQQKLDELISMRDLLIGLTNKFDLTQIQSINNTSDYVGKIQVIANNHRKKIKENTIIFANAAKEIENLNKINVRNFKNENKNCIDTSSNTIKLLINKINIDIEKVHAELTKLISMDNIRKLCKTKEYNQKFLDTYLTASMAQAWVEPSESELELTLSNIKTRCEWRYPGLQLNPISTIWVDCMVAADPLYLIQYSDVKNTYNLVYESLQNIINQYPPEYQRRLRIYDIRDYDFSALPTAQFGCIACCNFLNFFSPDIIKTYLTTFFKLLRPGGSITCTLRISHTCLPDSLVEQDYFKYAADLVIQKLFKDIGYEIKLLTDMAAKEITWECIFLIEASKPGVLTTTKAHQVAGKILEK